MAATLADFKGWQIIVTDENGSLINENTRRRRRRGATGGREIIQLKRKSDGLILKSADSIVCRDPQTNMLSIYMIHEIRLNTASNYVELWCLGYLSWYEINPEGYYMQFLPEALESCPEFTLEIERADYFREKFQQECNRSELYLTAELSEIYLKDLVSLARIYHPDDFTTDSITHENQTSTFVVTSACEPDGNNFVHINIREIEENIRNWDPEKSKKYVKELTASVGSVRKKLSAGIGQQKKQVDKLKKEEVSVKEKIFKQENEHESTEKSRLTALKVETSDNIVSSFHSQAKEKSEDVYLASTKVDVRPTCKRRNTRVRTPKLKDSSSAGQSLGTASPERSDEAFFDDYGIDSDTNQPSSVIDADDLEDTDMLNDLDSDDEAKQTISKSRGQGKRRKLLTSSSGDMALVTPKKASTKKNITRAKKAYTPFSKLYKRPQDIPDLTKSKDFYKDTHDWDISALENQFRSPTKQKTIETIFSKVKKQLTSGQGKDEILKASNFSDYLPARENEFATIYLSMYSAIEAGTGTSIYIAGTPGVGKTLTVREVVKELLISADRKELPQFQYIEINGLKMVKPTDSYEVLWKKISGSTLTSGAAMESLEYYYKEVPQTKKRPVVVLLDELDALVTKNQDVMYNFFNWTTYENSKLIVVAVANTMDLPERQLGNKVSSRIGFTRIMFTGYTHTELKTIINLRLMGLNDSYFYVDPATGSSYLYQENEVDQIPEDISKLQKVRLKISDDAIEIASRKIASVSGDARRALKVCRRAVEIAEYDYMQRHGYGYDGRPDDRKALKNASRHEGEEIQKVEIHHITKALNETVNSPTDTYMSRLSFTGKLFLYSLVNLIKKTDCQEQSLGDIVDEIRLLLEVNGENKYIIELKRVLFFGDDMGEDQEEQLRIISWDYLINQLVETGIIIKQNLKNERLCAIKLNIAFEEVCKNIVEDEVLKTL